MAFILIILESESGHVNRSYISKDLLATNLRNCPLMTVISYILESVSGHVRVTFQTTNQRGAYKIVR